MKSLVVWSLLLARIAAMAFDAPMATPVWAGFELQKGLIPAPTEAPSMEEFVRRQSSASSVPGLVVAADGTCGFISGFSASPFGLCCSTCSCGFATTAGYYGQFYCCNSAVCESRVPTTCIDAQRFTAGSACDSKCEADPKTMKCTAAPYTFCNLAEFETVNVQALFCDSVTVSHTQSMFTTYSGEVGRVLTPWKGPSASSLSSSTSTSTSSSSTSTSTSTTSSSPPTTTTAPTSSTTDSSGATQTSTTSTPAPASTPIAPIVGGVVGGVGGIALIAGVIFFLLRRKRSKPESQVPPNGPGGTGPYAPPMQQQPPYGGAAVGGAAGGAAGEKIATNVVESPEYAGGKPAEDISQYPQQQYGNYHPPGQQQTGYQQPGYQQHQGQYQSQPYPPQQYGGAMPPQDSRYSTQTYSTQPGYASPEMSSAGAYGTSSEMHSPPPENLSPHGTYGYGQSPMSGAAELHGVTQQSPAPTYNTTATAPSQGHVIPPAENGMRYEVQG